MKITSLCHLLNTLNSCLEFYAVFGPELPNRLPDPAFGLLVKTTIALNYSQSIWKNTPGSEGMELCFLEK